MYAIVLTNDQLCRTREHVTDGQVANMGHSGWLKATRTLRRLLSAGGATFQALLAAGHKKAVLQNELAWLEQNGLAECKKLTWTLTKEGFDSLNWVSMRSLESKERSDVVSEVAKKHGLSVHQMLTGPLFGPSVAARGELFARLSDLGVSDATIAVTYGFTEERVSNAVALFRRRNG